MVSLATVLVVAAIAPGSSAQEAAASRAHRTLLPMFDGEGAVWSPDSLQIAIPESKSITLRGTDGRVQRRLRGPGIGYFGFPCEPCSLAWTDGGARVQFLSHEEEYESDDWVVGSVAVDGGR